MHSLLIRSLEKGFIFASWMGDKDAVEREGSVSQD